MIQYKLEDNWLKFIYYQFISKSFRRTYRVMFVAALYGALAMYLSPMLDIPDVKAYNAFSLLGAIYGLLIIFKSNQSYSRWWEGRKLWGALVNDCRNFAIYVHHYVSTDAKETRKFYANVLGGFPNALAIHLRKQDRAEVETALAAFNLEKRNLSEVFHMPSYMASLLYKQMSDDFKSKRMSEAELINLKVHHKALLDITGACERIAKTPLPFSYQSYIKILLVAFILLLPFPLFAMAGWYSLGFYLVVIGILTSLDVMAEEIEEPFGLHENDLPLDSMSRMIRYNVFEIMGMEDDAERPEVAKYYSHIY